MQTEEDDNKKLKAVKEMRCSFELWSRGVELRLPRRRRVFLPLSGEISARLCGGQRPFSLKGG